MRIITGKYRGKNLFVPEGLHTRPTTARIKESIFNIIQFDIEGRKVLDMFAGSGQMGLEALSRGAESCVFCDTDREALKVIGKNITLCKAEGETKVVTRDAVSYVSACPKNSFGLIFIDPPYKKGLAEKAIKAVAAVDILQDGGIIICESEKNLSVDFLAPPYRVLKEYVYGITKITTITKDSI